MKANWLLIAALICFLGVIALALHGKENNACEFTTWPIVEETTVNVICETLENRAVGGRWRKSGFVNTKRIQRIVRASYDAAKLNPSFGGTFMAGRKLLAAFYIESGFDQLALNKYNKDKSRDYGLGQINTIHVKRNRKGVSTFDVFKRDTPLPFTPKDLWDIETNVYFSAYVNEKVLKCGGRGYKYFDKRRPDSVIFWKALMYELPERLLSMGIDVNNLPAF